MRICMRTEMARLTPRPWARNPFYSHQRVNIIEIGIAFLITYGAYAQEQCTKYETVPMHIYFISVVVFVVFLRVLVKQGILPMEEFVSRDIQKKDIAAFALLDLLLFTVHKVFLT